MPFTVIGEVEVEVPLPGVVMVAPWVGGALVLVASTPYEPGFGCGVGIGFNADTGCTLTKNASRHAPIEIGSAHLAFMCFVSTMFMLIVARLRWRQKCLLFAARFFAAVTVTELANK